MPIPEFSPTDIGRVIKFSQDGIRGEGVIERWDDPVGVRVRIRKAPVDVHYEGRHWYVSAYNADWVGPPPGLSPLNQQAWDYCQKELGHV